MIQKVLIPDCDGKVLNNLTNRSIRKYARTFRVFLMFKNYINLKKFIRKYNLFNKREIEKATKHFNEEMDESPEDFYTYKEDKEKDDGFER